MFKILLNPINTAIKGETIHFMKFKGELPSLLPMLALRTLWMSIVWLENSPTEEKRNRSLGSLAWLQIIIDGTTLC